MNDIRNINHLLNKWQQSIVEFLPKVLLALIVLISFYFVAKFFRNFGQKFYPKIFKSKPEAVKIIASFIYFFFLFSGAFLALEVLGLESLLTKLLAGAGIVGIVAGFAFKDIASNAFAGFLLNVQHPFKIGDWVEIDNTFGVIENISLITTSVKTVTGQEVFIPNQLIYNNTFTNYSTYGKRRIVLKSGVSYGDDLTKVKSVALDEVNKIDSLLKNETIDFYYTDIGASTYNFEVRFWINFKHQKDFLEAKSDIIIRIKKRFEDENISIAYNVTTLDFDVKGGVNIFDKPIHTKTQ
ncbi:mechanosensitive ion channel [Tenacibaculum aiptasiae]|uniref:Mechanosensitive ion channel n=1 Tax=Tenacibaculum aiptasiae TaxID=426481 RepID=A0A7J5AP85_9FLAO|nr:mechanosensitive ion channel family protein [Tenacibaculum aiptasiae]KAB1159332.1 mechanosensitive ion channel [Tenacibaculum aiptasiae]